MFYIFNVVIMEQNILQQNKYKEQYDDTKKISAKQRRLDSLAHLMTGPNVCTAVAFDGKKFLLANNTGDERLALEYIGILGNLAQIELLRRKANKPPFTSEYIRQKMSGELHKLIEKSIAPVIQQKEIQLNIHELKSKLSLLDTDYIKYLKQELEKVVSAEEDKKDVAGTSQKDLIIATLDLLDDKNFLNNEKIKIELIKNYFKAYLVYKNVAKSDKIDGILSEIKSLAELKNALKNGQSIYKIINNKPESLKFMSELVKVCELNNGISDFLMAKEKEILISHINKKEKIIDKKHTLEILTRAASKIVSSIFRPDSMGAFSQEMLEAMASAESGCIFVS